MENRDRNPNNYGNNWESPRSGSGGKVMAGLLLIVVGLVILASKLDIFFLPYWVFSWQMFLIVLGLFIGFKQNFRKSGWLVLVLIGSAFLLNEVITGFSLSVFFWPFLLIGIGLWVMLKPRNRYDNNIRPKSRPNPTGAGPQDFYTTEASEPNTGYATEGSYSSEEVVDITAILGGIKKNIISKNFRGGEIVSVFGGSELNLSQSDLQRPAVLEATQIFGGTTLIVPPHWEVKSEIVAILGGFDDKRPMPVNGYDPNKVLVLKGTSLFGGLNIKSY
ncbi:hypothetical protein CLV24_13413 [Pontibacter ummariensis]|uniref:LiaF transmembrane domain-containing protein n=1 Tax=Pontibacter ummariensis TaxID=1610492 RepID=A0A239L0Z0_9BACT|nr:hypothetical protein [Pontibacter ummariensis]PRY04607.1 hypothetical protein CLV24_13413 [Pontibacter ummariensis]SNT24226.1 hypothetical protein SAMN06296052_13430 [Pontibacter ummariensis]